MPDLSLDPSALNISQPPPTSSLSGKSNGAYALPAPKVAKVSNVPPRIDLEPLCAALKSAIHEYWAEYKEALGDFIKGRALKVVTPRVAPYPASFANIKFQCRSLESE